MDKLKIHFIDSEPSSEPSEAGQPEPGASETVTGPDGKPTPATGLILGYERFNHPYKHYRLIWSRRRKQIKKGEYPFEAWPAEEDQTWFRTVHQPGGVIEAGQKLAEQLGVTFEPKAPCGSEATGSAVNTSKLTFERTDTMPQNRRVRRARNAILRRMFRKLKQRARRQAKAYQAINTWR